MAATMLAVAAAGAAVSSVSKVSFSRTQGVRTARGVRVVRMATPKGSSGPAIDSTGDKVTDKIEEAQEACAGNDQSEECVTAWNEVESAQAEKAKNKGKGDPLEEYCEDNPEADECRVYKD